MFYNFLDICAVPVAGRYYKLLLRILFYLSRLGFKTCLSKTKTKTLRFKTKTKTSMSKTKTETQDLQDQYWKSVTGMDCDTQKD